MRLSIGAPPDAEPPVEACCLGWYAEAQRALLLFETLAEDHFPDQQSFDEWVAKQQRINLRREQPDVR